MKRFGLFRFVVVIFSLLFASTALADSIYGSCRTRGGDKCTNIHKISTSWNSKKAYPGNGRYELDLGGTVDKRITVYCDGKKVGTIYVKGRTEFSVVCR